MGAGDEAMTKDDIIRMAREVGFKTPDSLFPDTYICKEFHLERFAQLVAAAEREACAKVCEYAPEPDGYDLAERIRARGQQ